MSIINSVRSSVPETLSTGFFSNDENCVNFFHTLLNCEENVSSTYTNPGINITTYPDFQQNFWKIKAETSPPSSDFLIRQKMDFDITGSDVFLTIKKSAAKTNSYDYKEDDCYFSLDDGTDQKTDDISFEIFF